MVTCYIIARVFGLRGVCVSKQVRILVVLSNLFTARVAFVWGVVVLALFFVVGCQAAAPSSEVESGARKVVTFDGGEVTEGEVQEEVERLFTAQAAGSGQPVPEVSPGSPQFEAAKTQVVPQLIAFNLTKTYARENGIEVSGEEVQEEIDQTKEQVGEQAAAAGQDLTPDEAFQEALNQFGFTEDEFREEVRMGLLLREVREEVSGDAGPTPEEVEEFYEENREARFTRPEQRCIRHILFTEDEEERAEEIQEEEEVPFEEASPEIEEQLSQQQQATDFDSWIQSQLEERNAKYLPGYDPNEARQLPGLPPGAGTPKGDEPPGN